MKFLEGTAAAVFVAEVEETISHAVDDALEWLEENTPDSPPYNDNVQSAEDATREAMIDSAKG